MEKEFKSKDGKVVEKLGGPIEGNNASKVLWEVLNAGKIPENIKLQWAPSYKGYFIARKGKNCCGAFKRSGVLVVNGIAKELEEKGIKGIYCPETSKSYKGIDVSGYKEGELKTLARTIANVLGFAQKAPTPKSKKVAHKVPVPA